MGEGGECGCVGEIRHEGSTVVVAAEAVELCDCGMSGGQGEEPGLSLNQQLPG